MVAPRYSAVAIAIHWLTAIAVLALIPMGWWMADAIAEPGSQAAAYRTFQLHKSVGLTVLALTLFRIAWRLSHRPPADPPMKRWEIFLARATHVAFYGLLLALPLSGWLYVSAGWSAGTDQAFQVATAWFGLFPVPHLPGVEGLAAEARRSLAHQAMGAHSLMAWGVLILAALHVGAALKHHLISRDNVLAHMVPGLPLRPQPEPELRPGGGAAAGAAAIGLVALLVVAGVIAGTPAPPAAPLDSGAQVAAAPAAAEAPTVPGTAQAWRVDPQASVIAFSGVHAGRPFEGRFGRWSAEIWFDPQDLAGSKAVVTVETGSARTGDATQEGSIGAPEWLDVSGFPTARFEAGTFRALGGDRYEAQGVLRLKGRETPVVLPFTFALADGTAEVAGTVTLDRTAMDVGMASDPAAEWVSREIEVRIAVRAQPAG